MRLLSVIDILVQPGSHAAEMAGRLREIASPERFEVHVAPRDAGLALHGDRDVILVHGPIEIVPGTLERLADCAARESAAATISVFSNRAHYGGYPAVSGTQALPSGETVTSLSWRFAGCNAGETVDIPAPDGPLVFLRRAALGEDSPGSRHLLCGDAFAFDLRSDPLSPEPAHDAQDFLERDPARPLRRRVDLARLMASRLPRLLLVSHRWGGGVERHVQDVARLAAEVAEVLVLRPDGARAVELSWMRTGESLTAWFSDGEWGDLLTLLAAIGVARVHFHHIHQLPRAVLDLPAALAAPYDVTLHDYFPVCPRYHLSPADGQTCEKSLEPCDRCLEPGPAQWGLTLAQWRETFHGFLRDAARVIAPSRDCVSRIQRYYPDVRVLEWAHPETPQAPPVVYKVVLLGGLSAIKGMRVLEACVADARARRLPLHFHVIGHIDQPTATLPVAPLTVGGSYSESELPLRIAIEKPDAILFLPQVAETYSYTLSAAMASTLPIVALAAGALPERLRSYPSHALLAPGTPAAKINDALLALVHRVRELASSAPIAAAST